MIVGPSSGGTVDKVAPASNLLDHMWEDVYPFLMCCPEFCNLYYECRPSDNGTAYEPPEEGILSLV